jgi:hypothetical protein
VAGSLTAIAPDVASRRLVPDWQCCPQPHEARLEDGGVLKALWVWLGGRSNRAAFKDEALLRERRKALTDSARRQAAQLRADQEAGRSAVGPWSSALGASPRDASPLRRV